MFCLKNEQKFNSENFWNSSDMFHALDLELHIILTNISQVQKNHLLLFLFVLSQVADFLNKIVKVLIHCDFALVMHIALDFQANSGN